MTTILLELNNMKFATRSQLQEVCEMGGTRNANRILARLESEKLIRSLRLNQKVYGLARAGCDLIGVDEPARLSHGYLDHTLLRNEAYLAMDQPNDWRNEQRMSFKGSEGRVEFVPDATCVYIGRKTFIEVDRTQRLSVTRKKIAIYSELQSIYRRSAKLPPLIKFYGICPTRVGRIRRMLSDANVEGTAELIA